MNNNTHDILLYLPNPFTPLSHVDDDDNNDDDEYDNSDDNDDDDICSLTA